MHPAACPNGRSGGMSSLAAATPAAGPKAARIHEPIDIGEVGLATRSMW
jgi:hypothetical protein